MRSTRSTAKGTSGHVERKLVCCYQNETTLPQIVRVRSVVERCVERTVFPGQIIRFEAQRNAVLEVNSCSTVTTVVSDHIYCRQLACAVPLRQRRATDTSKQQVAA